MQTSDRSGIACDHCGTIYENDFIYYSFDFHSASVENNRRPAIDAILRSSVTFSLDICEHCFSKLSQKVVDNYKKVMSKKRSVGVKQICEMTGNILAGTYCYYYIVVTRVNVKITGQPNVCVECHTSTWDDDKPCAKCQSTKFIRPAQMNTDERFLEVTICEDAFTQLRKQAEQVRKVASQWSSKGA